MNIVDRQPVNVALHKLGRVLQVPTIYGVQKVLRTMTFAQFEP